MRYYVNIVGKHEGIKVYFRQFYGSRIKQAVDTFVAHIEEVKHKYIEKR